MANCKIEHKRKDRRILNLKYFCIIYGERVRYFRNLWIIGNPLTYKIFKIIEYYESLNLPRIEIIAKADYYIIEIPFLYLNDRERGI